MHFPIVKTYYDQLKSDSLEKDVDSLWMNILGLYFPVAKKFGLEQERRPSDNATERADVTIRYIRNGIPKRVVIIEDERVAYEARTSRWQRAVAQVTAYLEGIRKEQENIIPLYAIVTVGPYSRFYLFDIAEDARVQL